MNKNIVVIASVLIFALGYNLLVGSTKLESFECANQSAYLLCDKKVGFDTYTLFFSLPLIAGVIGLLSRYNPPKVILTTLITLIIWILTIELISHLLVLPVLYTHFMEGRQSLSLSGYFGFREAAGVMLIALIISLLCSYIGNIIHLFVTTKPGQWRQTIPRKNLIWAPVYIFGVIFFSYLILLLTMTSQPRSQIQQYPVERLPTELR